MKRKKMFMMLLMFVTYFIGNTQENPCRSTYMRALEEYNKGNYVEAQRNFVSVAQNCGKYSDLWNKLKSCNTILAQKQNQQADEIALLKQSNKQLLEEKRNLESKEKELEATVSNAAKTKIKLDAKVSEQAASIKELNKTIGQKEIEIDNLNDSISHIWRDTVASLNVLLKKYNEKISQSDENNVPLKKYNDLKTEKEKLESEKKQIIGEKEQLENEIKRLRTEKENIEKEKKKVEDQLDDLTNQMDVCEKEKAQLKQGDKVRCCFCRWKIKREHKKALKNNKTQG